MISEADKQRFETDGFLLVENVVPESLCAAVRAEICDFLHMDEHDPNSWPESQQQGHGIVPIHHAQPLWDVRQHPPVHALFAALHGSEALWVTSDRVSFKIRDPALNHTGPAEPIHWDGDPSQLLGSAQRSIQGLLYLSDTAEDQGAFCCAPGIYQHLGDYLAHHPEHARRRRPDIDDDGDAIRKIGGPAGSMICWDRRLPHSSSLNLTERPRWVQYIAMDRVGDEPARTARVAEFEARMPPPWAVAQAVSGQEIPESGPPVRLSALGRRLVGLAPW